MIGIGMAEEEIAEEEPPKKSKKGLAVGLVLALAGAGGGFYAVQSGLLFGSHEETAQKDGESEHEEGNALPEIAFVPVDQLIISLGPEAGSKHLLFKSQIEVAKGDEANVTALMPRIIDVMNSYLRAVDARVLEDPKSLIRLRAQMLRRIKTVVGEEHVRDLLITEFVLN